MRTLLPAIVIFLPVGQFPCFASDAEDRSVIQRAINALGGKKKLAMYNSIYFRAKGILYAPNKKELPTIIECWYKHPNMIRHVFEVEAGEMKTQQVIRVLNGTRAWEKSEGQTKELLGSRFDKFRRNFFQQQVKQLYPILQSRAIKLRRLPDSRVGNTSAHAIKISKKGEDDTVVYFDKTSFLPIKMTITGTNPDDGHRETMEVFLSHYKSWRGLLYPSKTFIKVNRNTYMRFEVTDFRFIKKPDAALFAKP